MKGTEEKTLQTHSVASLLSSKMSLGHVMPGVGVAAASRRFGAFGLARCVHAIEPRERMVADRHSDTSFVGTLSCLDASIVVKFLYFGRGRVVLALRRLGSLLDSVRWALLLGSACRWYRFGHDWRHGSGWCWCGRCNRFGRRDECGLRPDDGGWDVVISNRRSTHVLEGRLTGDLSQMLKGRQ